MRPLLQSVEGAVADLDGGRLPPRPTPGPVRFVARSLRKYWRIFRAALIERLTYRADFFIATLLRFLPMVTTILLWEAIYAQPGVQIPAYTRKEMVAYLLLVHISRMFSSMPGLAYGIARDIREGSLKKYLLQPINMIGYLVSYRAAHKVAYIATAIFPYGLLFFLCLDYFDRFPSWPNFLAYIVSLLLAFIIGFFFEACMGMIGFWMLEVTSLLYVVNTVNFFVSGQMFPVDILPGYWPRLLRSLPFQYLAYFPAAIFLEKVTGAELWWGLAGQAAWALFFMLLSIGLYRLGLRRYSAYGG